MHNTGFLRNTTQITENDDTTFGYMMAAQELEAMMTEVQKDSENPVEIEDLELVETPPTTPTEEHTTRADKPHPGHQVRMQNKHQFKQIHQHRTQL